jgi:hypothetical protein
MPADTGTGFALALSVTLRVGGAVAVVVVLLPVVALAQTGGTDEERCRTYTPITSAERVTWVVRGTVSVPAVGVGVFNSAWMTESNWPKEWHQNWRGFSRRYADGAAAGSIANSIEAGLGGFWGEDPRYVRSGRHGTWTRLRYAATTVALAPRRDGHLAPAWGRLAGNVIGNVIENSWLPPSVTTRGETTVRVADGLAARLVSNVWEEFWPDLRQRLASHKRRSLTRTHEVYSR